MATLTLPSGHEVIVDDRDYQFVAHWKWYAKKVHGTYHAVADIAGHRVSMQHLLMFRKGTYIYHLNGNGLDNRRQNLSLTKTPELLKNLRNQNRQPTLETY